MARSPVMADLRVLDRPDLRFLGEDLSIQIVTNFGAPFRVTTAGSILVSHALASRLADGGDVWHLRFALELAALLRASMSPAHVLRACFAAARTAVIFRNFDSPHERNRTDSLEILASDDPPSAVALSGLWPTLKACLAPDWITPTSCEPEIFEALSAWLTRSNALLGPSETLMAAGGDARLQLDPRTGLNHYGCSHRPRPWAATFASSTASSVSERGFAAAEQARLRLQRAVLQDKGQTVLADMARETREALAHFYHLPDGECVVLAPSGTDCELAALAIAEMNDDHRPVTNILIAPDETGRGVPLAAAGRHYADDTARLSHVARGELIDGFGRQGAAEIEHVALREQDGSQVPADILAADCENRVMAGINAGRHMLLHQLDLSKTGLLAPREETLIDISTRFGPQCDIVVDACQARLVPKRVGDWVRSGRAVMVTGSKFFTGPPFCGALLIPAAWRKRLDTGKLPVGLRAYAGRNEWPACHATADLSDVVNHGLILRWVAALAEMKALQAVPATELCWRLDRFLNAIRDAIGKRNDLLLLDTPAPLRPTYPDAWDDRTTILSFLVRAPDHETEEPFVPLGLEEARKLYRWLNADLRPLFTEHEPEHRSSVAGLLCHTGQPVALPSDALGGKPAGALRISAGARLLSGEPSHAALGTEVRMAQEISDARRILEKISLIRRHWHRIAKHDPLPTYAPVIRNDSTAYSFSQQNGDT